MSDRIISIAQFPNPQELSLFQARLEQEGIVSSSGDENISYHGLYIAGGAQLRVFERDAERALAIVNAMRDELKATPQQYQIDVDGTVFEYEEDEEEREYQAVLALRAEKNKRLSKITLMVVGIIVGLGILAWILLGI